MSKLPEITMADWMAVEETMRLSAVQPRPHGSITAVEYAAHNGCTYEWAQRRIKAMVGAGLATRLKWRNGASGVHYVYILKPKSKC